MRNQKKAQACDAGHTIYVSVVHWLQLLPFELLDQYWFVPGRVPKNPINIRLPGNPMDSFLLPTKRGVLL